MNELVLRLEKFGLKIETNNETSYSLLVDEEGLFHLNPWNKGTYFNIEEIGNYTKALETGVITIEK